MALLLAIPTLPLAGERDDYNPLTEEQEFSLAAELISEGRFAEAVEGLRASASAGHVPSQEVLGVVLLHGAPLFGADAPTDHCEATRWFRLALVRGSALAERYVPLLVRSQRKGAIPACADHGE